MRSTVRKPFSFGGGGGGEHSPPFFTLKSRWAKTLRLPKFWLSLLLGLRGSSRWEDGDSFLFFLPFPHPYLSNLSHATSSLPFASEQPK
ncbi:hypothetical protein IE53DRAFT_384311 [Violaceomyces palustris]|uniref:Uncharacterized protein n=1 Tax=Violaceomyces palustris TaxID=1673888 RepID=A0ACD0P568_9BASI|nr:hypothetical protein IE53DRAFT_384311 [Violaceomyces palustris]